MPCPYVMLSGKMLAVITEYRQIYGYKYWLFEGVSGERYLHVQRDEMSWGPD